MKLRNINVRLNIQQTQLFAAWLQHVAEQDRVWIDVLFVVRFKCREHYATANNRFWLLLLETSSKTNSRWKTKRSDSSHGINTG